MKRKYSAVLCLLLVFASLCLQGAVANASSTFDETYTTTNSLYAGDANCEFETNITNTWSSYITDESRWGDEVVSMTEDAKSAFIEAMENGDVSVSQVSWQQTSTRVGKYITVYFSEAETSNLVWSQSNNAVSVTGYQYSMLIGCNSGIDATHPTVYLFSTPSSSTTGTLSQNNGSSSPVITNFFTTATQNRPSGYDGLSIATQPIGTKYVAMGDSFSSGEGSFNYNLPGAGCHRSTDSYVYYLMDNLPLEPVDFVACSGAVTDDLFHQNPVNTMEDAQLGHLTQDTEVVTLTIGGNDMGFVGVMNECAEYGDHHGYGCSSNSTLINTMNDRLAALNGTANTTMFIDGREIHSISAVLGEIATKAPNASIYIAGYPKLFGSSTSYFDAESTAPGGYECAAFPAGFSYTDAQWMNDWADDINTVINAAVSGAVLNGIDVHYVSPALFDGHGLCDSGVSWMNWVYLDDLEHVKPESFHPTPSGMSLGYGLIFEATMS